MKTVITKHIESTMIEVHGIYRAFHLPMPRIGEEILVSQLQGEMIVPATVIGVNGARREYDVRLMWDKAKDRSND
jgi:hypothetical protein